MFRINNKMISSVSIHHNSFANDLMWRTHFPVKQESLDDSASNISPEIYADTENELDQQKTRPEHLAGFIPPTMSSSPTVPSQQGIYLSPTYQQRDLSCHFRASPSRISPYPMRSSPNIPHSKSSPTFHSPNSILSSPSPSGLYHQKISPSGCEVYGASTPDKSRASPGTNSDLYRTSPNISADFHRGSPTSHISGASSSFGSDLFQSPHSYSHLPQSAISMGITPNDIYRSLNGPKTSYDSHTISPRSNMVICEEPLNMNSMQVDLSQRLSPQQHSPSYLGNNRTSPISNDPQRVSPHQVSSERKLSPLSMLNQESHDSSDSRSPSPPVQNLKMMLQKTSSQEFWTASTGNSEAHISEIEAATDVPSNSLKCYFCSYNTKSRIQLNKHMRDAHTESKMMPSNENETDEDNENETHSNLSEDFMMDEYDDEDGECDEFAVNINKVSQNANSNKRTSYKCKKCALTFKNKDEYYVHQRDNHIKREKLLECKLCPFVTEYKHHHEYHIKNHFKMKPFKCSYSNCKYSCNNQSMLNSHVKSHKSFYQFHCKNCNYATKYMHSFKLHLRKNNHEKGITLNEDGSVNNDIIIDIHGTRRGPKRKSRKLDENALQNINNNNCITQTIKKTIHQEPETEYNNNVTMSSNNGSSRSNSPLSNVNYNNNNNDSYYLNTKLFVYSHMASMINEKTPEIWVKDTNTLVDNFKQLSNVHDDIPEVVDLSESAEEPSEMQVDTEAPLDLSKTVDIKPQHNAMDLVKTGVSNTMETIQNQEVSNVGVFNGNQKIVDSSQSLIKIENRVKTSADMIRIVGKNNYDIEHGNIFKNKNKIKLCKNNEKSIKNAFEKMKTGNVRSSSSRESVTILEPNVEIIDQSDEIIIEDNKTKNCDKSEEKKSDLDKEITIDITTNDTVIENPKKSPIEESLSEANKQAISTNKNRRRKGKAYKLQINNDYVEKNINSELKEKDEEVAINVVANSPTVDSVAKTASEMAGKEQTTIPSSYEIQMDYLKQIQNQYLKTFQQNKCLDNCAVPLLPQNNNINNNVNSSQLFDAKSQILSKFSQKSGLDFVGSHLKNLERINSHLLQNSLNMSSRKKSEGLKPIDNIFHNKSEDQYNILNPYLVKRNEANLSMNNNNRLWYKCELCDIQYLDEFIYSIHMRYHNIDHPYKCNLCGLQTNNKFQFNLHIIQTPH